MTPNRLCVFCGSRPGARPEYALAARAMGRALAPAGLELVFGGSGGGLMGAVADGALEGGAKIIGIFPQRFPAAEFAHPRLTETHVVGSMHERKALMHELSGGFVALPGGFGTLDELFETLTWTQIGLHHKPIGLLDTNAFYQPLMAMVRHGLAEDFVPERLKNAITIDADPTTLVSRLISLQTV